jgi:hypothetical protein
VSDDYIADKMVNFGVLGRRRPWDIAESSWYLLEKVEGNCKGWSVLVTGSPAETKTHRLKNTSTACSRESNLFHGTVAQYNRYAKIFRRL